MSHRSNPSLSKRDGQSKQEQAKSTEQVAGGGAGTAAPTATSTGASTEALVSRLLNPSTSVDEAAEYAHYIDQFFDLSLSQDLSEKDAALYRTTTALVIGEPDEGSRRMYTEMVQRSCMV